MFYFSLFIYSLTLFIRLIDLTPQIGLDERSDVLSNPGGSNNFGALGSTLKPQVAMKCGYLNQYLDRTGVWLSDGGADSMCSFDSRAVINYCQKKYPHLNITNIVEMNTPIRVDNWCTPEGKVCNETFVVYPIRCLEGKFQSEALLVPEGCMFDHVHSTQLCQTYDYWKAKAIQACQLKFPSNQNIVNGEDGIGQTEEKITSPESSYKAIREPLHSFSMLLPCGPAAYSGVEFVCCPPSTSKQPRSHQIKSIEETQMKFVDSDDANHPSAVASNVNHSPEGGFRGLTTPAYLNNVVAKNREAINTPMEPSIGQEHIENLIQPQKSGRETNIVAKKEPYNNPKGDDGILNNKIDSQPTDSVISVKTEDRSSSTIKTLLNKIEAAHLSNEDLIKQYYASFDKEKEHDKYVEVKNWMKEKRKNTIINLMKDWTLSEKRYNQIKSKDPYLAQKYKEDISKSFQKTISALEAEEKAQKKQLIAIHEQRVTSLLNAKKRKFMFAFLKELEKPYPTPALLKDSLEKLLRAEEHDKMHVIHYYEHLLNADPASAARIKGLVGRHVQDIERRMNRSVTMLERRLSPIVYEPLRPEIESFIERVKTRNGDFAELTRSIISETISTTASSIEEDTSYTLQTETETGASYKMTTSSTHNIPTVNNRTVNSYGALNENSVGKSFEQRNKKLETDGDYADDTLNDDADDDDDDDEADDDEDDEADDDEDETDDNLKLADSKNVNKTKAIEDSPLNSQFLPPASSKYYINNNKGQSLEQQETKGSEHLAKPLKSHRIHRVFSTLLPYPFINIADGKDHSHDDLDIGKGYSNKRDSGAYHEALVGERSEGNGHAKSSSTFVVGTTLFIVVALVAVVGGFLMVRKRTRSHLAFGGSSGGKRGPGGSSKPNHTRSSNNRNIGGTTASNKNFKHTPLPTKEEEADYEIASGARNNSKFKKNLAGLISSYATSGGKYEKDNISNHVEVDNQSLEERHLANMQVNGYENPTYRYFEKIASKAP